MLSIGDIKNHSFVPQKGGKYYECAEVDSFFSSVLETLGALTGAYEKAKRDNDDLYGKIKVLSSKIEEYRTDEDNIRSALLIAQRAADSVTKEANQEAAKIIEEAQSDALTKSDAIKADADAYVTEVTAEADEYLKTVEFDTGDYERVMKNVCHPVQELQSAIWQHKNAQLGNDPIYSYCFDGDMVGDDAGAFHSSDLWFVFETLAKCWRPFTGKHYDLARQMCNYWANFFKSGNPNGPDNDGTPMPEWKEFTADTPNMMWFNDACEPIVDEPSDVIKFFVKRNLK